MQTILVVFERRSDMTLIPKRLFIEGETLVLPGEAVHKCVVAEYVDEPIGYPHEAADGSTTFTVPKAE